jgi:hypothetical protein
MRPPAPTSHDSGPLRQIAELPSFTAIVVFVTSCVMLFTLDAGALDGVEARAIGLALTRMVSQMAALVHATASDEAPRSPRDLFAVQLLLDLGAVALSAGHLSFIFLALASQAVLFWPGAERSLSSSSRSQLRSSR